MFTNFHDARSSPTGDPFQQVVKQIGVLSAQSTFAPLGYEDPFDWKRLAFSRIVSASPGLRNVLSVGDAWYERAAVYQACAARCLGWRVARAFDSLCSPHRARCRMSLEKGRALGEVSRSILHRAAVRTLRTELLARRRG